MNNTDGELYGLDMSLTSQSHAEVHVYNMMISKGGPHRMRSGLDDGRGSLIASS